jgi:hypothetical protein
MTVTTQAVSAALRKAGHPTARTRGVSVERSGVAVRKMGDKVRVYHVAPVRGGSTMIERYASTLRQAGFTVEPGGEGGWFINVTGQEA